MYLSYVHLSVGTVGPLTRNRFSMTPVAFPSTLPSYGLLIQLCSGGMVADCSVGFFFSPAKIPISTHPQLFHCLGSSELSIFDVWWGSVMTPCSAVIAGGGRTECRAERIDSGALTLAGIHFQRETSSGSDLTPQWIHSGNACYHTCCCLYVILAPFPK